MEQSYSEEEAQEILRERFLYYLEQKRDAGYNIVLSDLEISRQGDCYQAVSKIVQEKEQEQFRKIKKKTEEQKKE